MNKHIGDRTLILRFRHVAQPCDGLPRNTIVISYGEELFAVCRTRKSLFS